MSKTFTRKVHRGELKKKENAIANKKKEEAERELQEAAYWAIGARTPTEHDMKVERAREKEAHKCRLRELYEREMNGESDEDGEL